jgi:hypothetical protein
VAAPALSESLIVSGSEADVAGIGNDCDLRKIPPDNFSAAVLRTVIYDDDLVMDVVTWPNISQRLETSDEEVDGVPIQDTNREVHTWGHGGKLKLLLSLERNLARSHFTTSWSFWMCLTGPERSGQRIDPTPRTIMSNVQGSLGHEGFRKCF